VRGGGDDDDSDSDMEDDDSDADAAVTQETAQLHHRSVAHKSAINRVRCMHQQPGIVAVWGDNAVVAILNVSRALSDLAEETTQKAKNPPLQVCLAHYSPHLEAL
jgi:hypothetical protein